MGLLNGIGKILALIGGILVLINILLGLLSNSALVIPYISEAAIQIGVGHAIINLIITILAAVGLIMMFANRFDIEDEWLEGVLIIILAFFAGSALALVGGILVFIGGLL